MQVVKNIHDKRVFVVKENSKLLNDEDFIVVTRDSYEKLCKFAGCPEQQRLSVKNDVIVDNHGITVIEKEF